jgi:site-specific recombinase XerD
MPQAPVRPHRTARDWQPAASARRATGGLPAWDEAVTAFLRDARARNCSPATLENYRNYLLGPRARTFLADYRISGPADVTATTLRQAQADLLDAGLAPGTVATFHRVLRNFLGFCRREGFGVEAEALETSPPKQPTTAPEAFSDAEVADLVAACRNARDRFLITFLVRTGLRLKEAAALTVDDIVHGPDGSYVRVRQGKGAKDRVVPLDTGRDRFSREVERYIRTVRPRDTQSRQLFLSQRRDPVTNEYTPLTARGIQILCKRLGEQTGIHTFPHKFRHTFATNALRAGVDSLALQRALGHSTLAMVNRYVHFNAADLIHAWRERSD